MYTNATCKIRPETCFRNSDNIAFLSHFIFTGLPKMLVIRDYFGVPSPPGVSPLNAQIDDVIEVIHADPHSSWWEVR